MQTKYILLGIFLMVAVAQLYVPASMIMEQKDILETGKLYRFKIRPIDPSDPLRGKYIRLWFADDSFIMPDSINYYRNQTVYLQIYEGSDGYAKIKNVYKTKPQKDLEFLEATISYPSYFNDSTRLTINYPFNSFYLDENKAPIAEDVYRESQLNSAKSAWAIVKIKNGAAALEDVLINGISINTIISERQNDFQ